MIGNAEGSIAARVDRSSTSFKLAASLTLGVIWTAVLVLAWAVQPMSHSQIIGFVELDDGGFERVIETTNCNSLFDTEPRDQSEPIPDFEFGFDFQRTPCEKLHSDSRLLFAINAVVILGLFVGWVIWFRKSRRRS